jgi:tyrosyl-tRNA synthetase
MVGDPSGKSDERKLLDLATIEHNISCQKKQLQKFIDFGDTGNQAKLVNNYDWFKNWSFLDFIRDVGKHITVSYMMGKDSVRNRLEAGGISFTEFSYQLVQGYDFMHLYKHEGCKLQMGGSDQWGNITTGTELIRRMAGGEGFALTAPLITKSDGTKFGKSEGGNVWLDPTKTSPYKFYQFWLNVADEDAIRFIKIYSLKGKAEIEQLIANHTGQEHLRSLQKELAAEMTVRVHSEADLAMALKATQIFFGNGSADDLKALDEATLAAASEGMERFEVSREALQTGIHVMDLLATHTQIFPSKSEARKMLQANGFAFNKDKYTDVDGAINTDLLMHNRYLIAQKGKKQYFLIEAV